MLIEQCCRCVVESVIGVTVIMLSESRRKHQPNFLLHAAGRLRTDLIQMSAASANRLAERNSTAYILRIFTNLGTLTSRLYHRRVADINLTNNSAGVRGRPGAICQDILAYQEGL